MIGICIRSQDRKKIVYAIFVEICNLAHSDGSKCSECEIITRNDGNYIRLGTYSTEEKALKVLDKIVDMISRYECRGIFQMPQDDDDDEDYEV